MKDYVKIYAGNIVYYVERNTLLYYSSNNNRIDFLGISDYAIETKKYGLIKEKLYYQFLKNRRTGERLKFFTLESVEQFIEKGIYNERS